MSKTSNALLLGVTLFGVGIFGVSATTTDTGTTAYAASASTDTINMDTVFPDTQFRKAVEDRLPHGTNFANVTQTQLDKITFVSTPSSGIGDNTIHSLEGLQLLHGLSSLYLPSQEDIGGKPANVSLIQQCLKNNPGLQDLELLKDNLSGNLDLSNAKGLQSVQLYDNNLSSVNFQGDSALLGIFVRNNPALAPDGLKNISADKVFIYGTNDQTPVGSDAMPNETTRTTIPAIDMIAGASVYTGVQSVKTTDSDAGSYQTLYALGNTTSDAVYNTTAQAQYNHAGEPFIYLKSISDPTPKQSYLSLFGGYIYTDKQGNLLQMPANISMKNVINRILYQDSSNKASALTDAQKSTIDVQTPSAWKNVLTYDKSTESLNFDSSKKDLIKQDLTTLGIDKNGNSSQNSLFYVTVTDPANANTKYKGWFSIQFNSGNIQKATTPSTPTTPSGSNNSSSTSNVGSSSASNSSSATSSSANGSASSSKTSGSTSTGTALPNYAAKKGTAVYALRPLYMYKNVNFKKSQRIAKYPERPRINRPMFVVKDYVHAANGLLRYRVEDVNHGSKSYGKVGYITSDQKYVGPVYYATMPKSKTITVIAKKGIDAYKTTGQRGKVKHYKRGTHLRVKKLVTHHLTSRYQLTNGQYVTGNKKFVIQGKY